MKVVVIVSCFVLDLDVGVSAGVGIVTIVGKRTPRSFSYLLPPCTTAPL